MELSEEMTKLYYRGFSRNEIDSFEDSLAKILDNLTDYEEKD